MKAHGEKVSGAALIECVKAAAELARWKLAPEMTAQSSLKGGR
jgi:hypothetical protein